MSKLVKICNKKAFYISAKDKKDFIIIGDSLNDITSQSDLEINRVKIMPWKLLQYNNQTEPVGTWYLAETSDANSSQVYLMNTKNIGEVETAINTIIIMEDGFELRGIDTLEAEVELF
jgi:hypothetical protein